MTVRSKRIPAKLSCPIRNGSFREYSEQKRSAWEIHGVCTAFSSRSRIHSRKLAPKASTAAVTGVAAIPLMNRSRAANAQPCRINPR